MFEVIIHISNRRLVNSKDLKEVLNQLKDGRHLVTVKDLRKRSIPQNSYYWGVCVPLVRKGLYDNGFDEVRTNDDAHEVMKHVLLKKEMVSKQTGEAFIIAGSTKELNIPDMNAYIERVCRWAAEYLNVYIPSPNEEFADFSNRMADVAEE